MSLGGVGLTKSCISSRLPMHVRQKAPRGARNNIQKTTWHRAIGTYSPRFLNFLVRYASG